MKLYDIDDIHMLFDPMLHNHICSGTYCDADNPCEAFDQILIERTLALYQIYHFDMAVISEYPEWYDLYL